VQLKAKSLEKLKDIIRCDYGVDLNDENANQLGCSLLKLSRLALSAVDKAEEKKLTAKPINN
jgi:hypothetical protein